MREENKKSSKNEENKFKAQRLVRKKWFAPAVYLAAAAFVLSAVYFMQGGDEAALPEEGVEVIDTTSQNQLNQYGEDAVPVTATNEVLKMPVVNEEEVEIVGYFYDVNAESEEQERALVYYNNMYYQNKGIDLASLEGASFEVAAALSGTVIKVEQDSLLGNVIEINHDNGIITHYHSLETIEVEKGQTVKQGELLGEAGRNLYNKEAGVHLHFELRFEDTPVNPNDVFQQPIDSIGDIAKEKEEEKETTVEESSGEEEVDGDTKEVEKDKEKEDEDAADDPKDTDVPDDADKKEKNEE
ncbi:M23 family metallopeptidase [Bacillus solitudinis]|uniref:M23 family metallopeptidase n=1 Tax=Bacillus solitudinis TaxID=2014074 RepID=UPI000C23EC28|nr:M23 family metallopeptidase [Bacillus solitudinis]